MIDLKPADLSFNTAFDDFLHGAPDLVLHMVANIQYYYDCSNKAEEQRTSTQLTTEWSLPIREQGEHLDDEIDEELVSNGQVIEDIGEIDVEEAMKERFSTREQLYASVAIGIGEDVGVFDEGGQLPNSMGDHARVAKEDDIALLQRWSDVIQNADENLGEVIPERIASTENDLGNINSASTSRLEDMTGSVTFKKPTTTERSSGGQGLNEEQLMALTIL
ncbi:hypothetical protein PAXINDRAFT_12316 [Paxillus involutus ATCC 200175]|uniref:Unplaced genomic scaffold PAXINscaffold_17, whole genome shotgun sequence n=1 Tax=Paxillus involutus ATCC 200175 TaxID=664439 RepID=A0A0C9U7D9_PAXIN|nr:hypothetical protein PAXINDRAFT_12316 [Paxillus involutus ATCC 200175]